MDEKLILQYKANGLTPVLDALQDQLTKQPMAALQAPKHTMDDVVLDNFNRGILRGVELTIKQLRAIA